jgi:hypothetical protein
MISGPVFFAMFAMFAMFAIFAIFANFESFKSFIRRRVAHLGGLRLDQLFG